MKKFTALGAHIYAGGFTLGVLAAGFKVLDHLEEWEFGVATSRLNLKLPIRVGAEKWKAQDYRGKVDYLYANPPCASWSEAGRKVNDKETRNVDRYLHDGRTKCTELVFEQIPLVQPTAFTWESVAAATTNGAAFVKDRIALVNAQGYHVYGLLFNGADCGLPQNRRRFFFVASKVRLTPAAPNQPRTTPEAVWKGLLKGDRSACATRPAKTSLLPKVQPGEYLWRAFERLYGEEGATHANGQRKGRPGFLHYKIDPKKLCTTVTGGNHIYHHKENRCLTVLEQQLLCGYPPDYKFLGAPSNQYAQIAKAVLPPAGKWVASIVRKGLERNERIPAKKVGAELHNFITDDRRFVEAW